MKERDTVKTNKYSRETKQKKNLLKLNEYGPDDGGASYKLNKQTENIQTPYE